MSKCQGVEKQGPYDGGEAGEGHSAALRVGVETSANTLRNN